MTKLLIIYVSIGLCPLHVRAQDDDTIQFIQGLPVTGEDTVQRAPQSDVAPYNNKQALRPHQLPVGVREALNDNSLFVGWKKETIFLDKNTGLYWIHFGNENTVRSYGFNLQGDIVSFKETDFGK